MNQRIRALLFGNRRNDTVRASVTTSSVQQQHALERTAVLVALRVLLLLVVVVVPNSSCHGGCSSAFQPGWRKEPHRLSQPTLGGTAVARSVTRSLVQPFVVTASLSSGPIETTTTTTSTNTMRVVQGMRDVVDQYDVFLLDMWGVLHDGSQPYDGVLEAIRHIRNHQSKNKKRLVILSNSSKRKDHSMRMLTKLGFNVHDFDEIITSGEVAFSLLSAVNGRQTVISDDTDNALEPTVLDESSEQLVRALKSSSGLNGHNVFLLGSGDDDVAYCTNCGCNVTSVDEATLMVARGTFTIHNVNENGSEGVIDKNRHGAVMYNAALRKCLATAARRRLPLLVTNPDKIRPDADRSPMPGALGLAYQQALLQQVLSSGHEYEHVCHDNLVHSIGKPFAMVYQQALNGLGLNGNDVDLSRVCMIGDALETDIAGGSAMGLDTIWVLRNGIHRDELDNANGDDANLVVGAARIVADYHARDNTYSGDRALSPTIVLAHFRW
jgi:HAD superfamily hydrolase (TIGR01450 family)